MSRWLSTLLLINVVCWSSLAGGSTAQAAPSSLGPSRPEEAALLWKDARSFFEKGEFEEAAPLLKRLVDRYPGHAGYLEAHRLLGVSYLETERAELAIQSLKYFVEGTRSPKEAAEGKILLGRAYLDVHRSNEALLLAIELDRPYEGKNAALETEGLLLKARALMDLNQDKRASLAISSAKKAFAKVQAAPAALRGGVVLTELELKVRSCGLLGASGPLEEGQVLDQLSRRGDCIAEAVVLFRDLSRDSDEIHREKAAKKVMGAYQAYFSSCENPPAPPALKPKDRTQKQLENYRNELVQAALPRCRKKAEESLPLLDGPAFKKITEDLKGILSRHL